MRREVGSDPVLAQRYLVAIALSDQMRCVDHKTLSGIWEKLTQEQIPSGDVTKAAAATAAADDAQMAHAVTGVTIAAIQGLDVQHLTRLCKHHRLDFAKHWKSSARSFWS